MSRYIDADALLSKGHFVVRTNDFGEQFVTVEEINKMPTVDAVPVRCKDCKYDGRCMFQSFVIDNSRDEVPYDKNTFYCADGERRTE